MTPLCHMDAIWMLIVELEHLILLISCTGTQEEMVANPWAIGTADLSHETEMSTISSNLAAELSIYTDSSSTAHYHTHGSEASSKTGKSFMSAGHLSDPMDHDLPGRGAGEVGSRSRPHAACMERHKPFQSHQGHWPQQLLKRGHK